MKILKQIPSIWLRTYLFICSWIVFNLGVSEISTYFLYDQEKISTLISAAIAIVFSCILSMLILLWSRFLYTKRKWLQIALHFAGIWVTYLIDGLMSFYLNTYIRKVTRLDFISYLLEELTWLFFISNSLYLSTVFVFYIIRYVQGMEQKEKEKSRLETANQQMQLSLLKSQLNPHFLFNTLNILSSLIYSQKEKAREVLNHFSDILRYSLDSDKEKLVSLKEELSFIDDYLFIQKMRFEDRLTIERKIDSDCYGTLIPPMVLQPLVENAMVHGISRLEEGGTIKISIQKILDNIHIEIENSPLVNFKQKGNGLGLKNCNERLRLMFGINSELQIESNKDGFKVRFKIPA